MISFTHVFLYSRKKSEDFSARIGRQMQGQHKNIIEVENYRSISDAKF